MHRKIPLLLLLFSSLFYFCTDSTELTEQSAMNTASSPIVNKARTLLERCGNVVSLTGLKGETTSHAKSRAVEQTAYGVPMWEKATQLENGEEEILLVPLHEEQTRYSHTKIRRGNEESRQFASSFHNW